MIQLYLLALLSTSICFIEQVTTKCNCTVRYNHLKSKIDSAICIPVAHQIMKVNDVDLNNDGRLDKVIKWQKLSLTDGDTISYFIYTRNKRGKLELYKTLKNLEPIYFQTYSQKTGNKYYDSIKSIYSYPTTSEVEFKTNSINLKFYTDAATVKQLFFTYSLNEKTWILTREIQWLAPSQFEEERKQEYDRAPDTTIRIDDFDMLKYIGW